MERRGFLKGMFGGVTAAGLIIAAKPDEIAAFASPLSRNAPMVIDAMPVGAVAECGEHLYNARGELVAVITEINFQYQPIDVTSFNDDFTSYYVQGLPTFDIRARGVGSLEATRAGFPMLRGGKR